ncbi:Putative clathrin assembly protein [Zea mays]|uniref:Putative clathrin assembly protein n=1 Tax=Zea mays TaxID=4577 RepID=A0A1D6H1U7_MAIZE|nr:Putative clathrin assembly protein [Zea mays]
MGSWRKAYGALKDSTKVGLAKVNSEFKELDIAIVKATNHVECPPKERHVRKILLATSANRPRADLSYCIYALSRRLSKTKNWIVALKTLIVVHRLLREGDPMFKEEFLAYSSRGNILHIANFKDDSSQSAWDCSAWIRAYGCFLEERLECLRVLRYDIETERLVRYPQTSSKVLFFCLLKFDARHFDGVETFRLMAVYMFRHPEKKNRYIVKPGPCLARNSWSSCLHCSSCFSGLSASRSDTPNLSC